MMHYVNGPRTSLSSYLFIIRLHRLIPFCRDLNFSRIPAAISRNNDFLNFASKNLPRCCLWNAVDEVNATRQPFVWNNLFCDVLFDLIGSNFGVGLTHNECSGHFASFHVWHANNDGIQNVRMISRIVRIKSLNQHASKQCFEEGN